MPYASGQKSAKNTKTGKPTTSSVLLEKAFTGGNELSAVNHRFNNEKAPTLHLRGTKYPVIRVKSDCRNLGTFMTTNIEGTEC
jgi:hypothetical protein